MFTLTIDFLGTTTFESHHEDTNSPCMNDKCNVNSQNECMTPQSKIWCGTPTESNCKATTNVSHDQRCAYLCFPWSHLSSPLEDTPCDMVGFAVTTSTTIAEIRTASISPKVLSQPLSTEAINVRTMAVT